MKDFQLMLAPMEGYTGPAFRSFCAKNGADLTFTEMARIDALVRGNKATSERILIPDATPTQIQLYGNNEERLGTFLSSFKPTPGFKGFNINCSCPSPGMIQRGLGAAMMRRVSKVNRMAKQISEHGYIVSVKLRLGLNKMDKKNHVYMNLIEGVEADFFILHARHAIQTYLEPADFRAFEIASESGKEIIANGDISTDSQLAELRSIGIKGAMIGRPAILGPLIFSRLKNLPMPDHPFDDIKKIAKELGENPFYVENLMKAVQSEGRVFYESIQ